MAGLQVPYQARPPRDKDTSTSGEHTPGQGSKVTQDSGTKTVGGDPGWQDPGDMGLNSSRLGRLS